jgi:hypothetical protein
MKNLLAVIALAVAVACSGTETGNPFVAEVRVHAHSSEPTEIAVVVSGGGAVATSVWLQLGPLAFVESGCGASIATTTAPAEADYAGAAVRVEGELTSQPLCSLRAPLEPAAGGGGAPAEVVGASVYVAGTRSDGIPFIALSTRVGIVEVTGIDGDFVVDADSPALFLGLDVATWFADVDLDGATPIGGTVRIDALNDLTRVAAFDAAIAAGIELYLDPNADGSADDPGDLLLARGSALTP